LGFFLQAAVLCSLAAFVAGQCQQGVDVAQAYASMAAEWAQQAVQGLNELRQQPRTDALATKQAALKHAASFSSALVVISLSYLPNSLCEIEGRKNVGDYTIVDTVENALVHMVHARFYHLAGDDTHTAQSERVWELALSCAAASTDLWVRTAKARPSILDSAFSEAPAGMQTFQPNATA
jgi:hypothetical protein